jgi:hypothetical protein
MMREEKVLFSVSGITALIFSLAFTDGPGIELSRLYNCLLWQVELG